MVSGSTCRSVYKTKGAAANGAFSSRRSPKPHHPEYLQDFRFRHLMGHHPGCFHPYGLQLDACAGSCAPLGIPTLGYDCSLPAADTVYKTKAPPEVRGAFVV